MNRLRTPGTALTRRETEVLTLVAEGLSNQAVGDRLHLTEGTVKSHLARIYAKLGVDSRTAAVATATHLGLIRR
jgi:ATP/maltotriose-dependent transcriptional regulator MalT